MITDLWIRPRVRHLGFAPVPPSVRGHRRLSPLWRGRGFEDAENVAAVLTWRVSNAASRPTAGTEPHLIAGLLAPARGPLDPETREALNQRADSIVERAQTLAATAVRDNEPWVSALGPQPIGVDRRGWLEHAAVVATYRDRYRLCAARTALGAEPATVAQSQDRARAQTSIRRARTIARQAPTRGVDHPLVDLAPR